MPMTLDNSTRHTDRIQLNIFVEDGDRKMDWILLNILLIIARDKFVMNYNYTLSQGMSIKMEIIH